MATAAEVTDANPAGFGMAIGVVVDFDADVGLGTIEAEDGTSWPFHCTAIADGTRTIGVGTLVRFDRRPAGPGFWEAFALTS